MDLTYTQLRNLVQIYGEQHRAFTNWYAFMESVGIGERYNDTERLVRILDPHLFTLACIRYGFWWSSRLRNLHACGTYLDTDMYCSISLAPHLQGVHVVRRTRGWYWWDHTTRWIQRVEISRCWCSKMDYSMHTIWLLTPFIMINQPICMFCVCTWACWMQLRPIQITLPQHNNSTCGEILWKT